MSTKHQERQRVIRHYKEVTGRTDVDLKEVAKWAVQKGLDKLPTPKDPYDILANYYSDSAREETRTDRKTGRPYRANHVYVHSQGGQQLHLWIDIDDLIAATRVKMHKSLIVRREQMVGDAVQLTYDAEHWNSIHAKEEPITMPLDFGPDVEWRTNASEDNREAV